MDSLQIFILAVLGLIAIVGVHRRSSRRRLIQRLLDEDRSADEIDKIMNAYRGEDQ